ncbi:hypothetical protein [Silicimonas algicola]|nr:hypothetical protein [Silicimonas algicola]
MVLFYDIEGDVADHDAWHTEEHVRERLSVPGFRGVSRWVSKGSPRYMVLYEVDDVDVATSPEYLGRLNDPSPWTERMMPRFRGMTRGFGRISASVGLGLGSSAVVMRFDPGSGDEVAEWFAEHFAPGMDGLEGLVSAFIVSPSAPPPMTREQSLRGGDKPLPYLLVITGYEQMLLERVLDDLQQSVPPGLSHFVDIQPAAVYCLHLVASLLAVGLRDDVPRKPSRF